MKTRAVVVFLLIVALTIGLSMLSSRLWMEKPEALEAGTGDDITISEQMTVRQIASVNGLSPKALKGPLGLSSPADLDKTLADLGLSADQAKQRMQGARALAAEESSKNWFKIPLKFALWIAFLALVFRFMRYGRITPPVRKVLLVVAVAIFGVVLGSDPSPMGTVKDAIVLWGKERVIFPPRLIALIVFLLTVVLANKFICSWGCQLGVLQDLVFRMNRNIPDTASQSRQWKPPFVLTNAFRIVFFVALCVFAVVWSTDIVSPIDPFRVFSPGKLSAVGAVFAGLTLVASLFVYRPWCHFLCPFGLVGWMFEKISVYKIKVNYETCIACQACARACPSTVMGAILKRDRVIPDCFSCGTCQSVCPTKSIDFDRGARTKPPAGKFADPEIPSASR